MNSTTTLVLDHETSGLLISKLTDHHNMPGSDKELVALVVKTASHEELASGRVKVIVVA